ncbi:MAG: CDP-alcohol phosphatidyltransferase family protein, partial [Lachnospiraceae bacterium]
MKKLIENKKDLFTIPNLMGYFRILLIPFFMILYIRADSRGDYIVAALLLGISGLTDCFDGKVARHFNMVTEWGKVLDPVADKLTQAAVFISLAFRYPTMRYLVALFVIKELFMACMGYIMLRRGKMMDGARWYGKLCTAVLYIAMFVLLICVDIPYFFAGLLIALCFCTALFSFVCYIFYYARVLLGKPVTEGKIKMWKPIVTIIAILLVYVGVNGAVAVISCANQPEVTVQTADATDVQPAYTSGAYIPGAETAVERAVIIEDNNDALLERIRMIQGAQSEIILSTFDFKSDESGMIVLGALREAADRGVKVNVLVDGFSGLIHMKWNPYFYALSSMENATIKIYNELGPFTLWKGMGRMHDKYLIADNCVYMLGGRNTYNYFLGDYGNYRNYDRDVLVYCEEPETNASVNVLKAYYDIMWDYKECRLYPNNPGMSRWSCVKKAAKEIDEAYAEYCGQHEELREEYSYAEHTYQVDGIRLLANPIQAGVKEPLVWHELIGLMKEASSEVKIHTPYIICNDMMYSTLSEAAAYADVTIMTNSVANNGNSFG